MENNDGSDKPFAVLLSMGYSDMYIQRALKVHRKSKFGTNWDLWVLIQIIDRLKAIDWQNEKEYHSKLLNTNSNHTYSKSLNLLPPPPQNNQNLNSDLSSIHELLYMKAISLYENKHYEECERVIKDVLRRNPNHSEALLLYKDLVEQRLTHYNNYNCISDKQIKQKKNSRLFGIANGIFNVKKRKNMFKESVNSDHPCRIEFRRFLRKHIQLNEFYGNLENKFVSAKYDDIRILKDFDVKMLATQIGLKPLHCKLFMKKVKIFIDQVKIFQKWLESFVDKYEISMDLLTNCLENNGILTFDTLYRHIKCISDLDQMIQNNVNLNANISRILWNEMQLNKCINKKKHRRSKTMEIHNDKNHSHAVHWGFTKDGDDNSGEMVHGINNDEKLNDDEFIAALSPAAKSIEDMFMSLKLNEPLLQTSGSSNIIKPNDAMSINSYNNYSSEEMESETTYI